jgi:hypothetical protein
MHFFGNHNKVKKIVYIIPFSLTPNPSDQIFPGIVNALGLLLSLLIVTVKHYLLFLVVIDFM